MQAHVLADLRVARGRLEGELLLVLDLFGERRHRTDHRVLRWQAERVVPEDQVGPLWLVGGVHAARVSITPESLDGLVEVERCGTRRLEQQVDRRDRTRGRAHLVTSGAGT